MLRRSPRLAAKHPIQVDEPVQVVTPVVGGSGIYLEPIEETLETTEPTQATVVEPVIESRIITVENPVRIVESTITTQQQQINNEVVARIHMFNRNIDMLTTKITDLSTVLDEMKKKKVSKRKFCSLM